MEAKKLLLNFHCGNKGQVFLLDVLIASFIVLVVLIVSVFFIAKAEGSSFGRLQASRMVNDIFAILDYNGVLGEFDLNKIKSEINSMLPEGYRTEYKIACGKRVYDSRTNLTEAHIFAGERVFVDGDYNPCIVRYWIWVG